MTAASNTHAPYLALTLVVAFACDRGAPGSSEEPPPPPSAEAEVEPPPLETVLDMPAPAGATIDELGSHHAHLRVRGSFDEVTATYTALFPAFEISRHADGVMFKEIGGESRSIYLYRDRRASAEVLVTYFSDSDDAASVRAREQGDRPEVATGQGAVAPAAPAAATGRPATVGAWGARASTRVRSTTSERSARVPPPHPGASGVGSTSPLASGGLSGGASSGGEQGGASRGGTTTVHRIEPRRAPARGGSDSQGRRPLNFSRGVYEPPGNPNAYY